MSSTIRPARTEELAAVGALTVEVYREEQLAPEEYLPSLAAADDRARHTDVLVAVDAEDRLMGAVALVLDGGPYAELSRGRDEAEFRMLAVSAEARGQGLGTALIQECLTRARTAGKQRMLISSGDNMTSAHRRYEALGFLRVPDLDWSPQPGVTLLAYVLELGTAAG